MNKNEERFFEFDGFRLDADKRLLFRADGETVSLMPKALDILVYLVRSAGVVVEKSELMDAIWPDTAVEENNLTQNISALRRALGEKHRENRFIATVPSRGYKFVAEVKPVGNEGSGVGQPGAGPTQDHPADATPVPLPGPKDSRARPAATRQHRTYLFYGGAALVGFAVILAVYFASTRRTDAGDPIRSVAVLPFTNSSQVPDTEYLSDGVAENVINGLSRLTDLKVMSRNSTFRFRGDQTDIRGIGTKLGVDALVTGDVRQMGADFIINVRLIDARDERQIWGDQYVKSSADLIAAQNEIARAVAENLRHKLTPLDAQLLARRETQNPAAWQLYQRGRFHVFRLTPSEVQKGIEYFQQAIEIDPSYALAYSGIADAYRSLALSSEMPPVEYLNRSKAAASRAIELDDSLSEGHSSLGMTIFWGDWDWRATEEQYRRALDLNPNNALAHLYYAHLLSNLGRHTESAAEMRLARELDPLFPFGNALEGQFLIHAGLIDEGLAQLEKTVELAPDFWMPYLFASSGYIEKGMFTEAIASARKASELSRAQTVSIAYESYAMARSGDRPGASANLNKLLALSNERFVPATHIAMMYVGLGEREKALDWLEKAFEQHDPKLAFIKVEPKWADLRGESRFIELMRRMNF